MVQLHGTYSKQKLKTGLSWSLYCQLMSIPDTSTRVRLEHRTIRENLTYQQLTKLVRIERGKTREQKRPTGRINTYRITTREMLNGKNRRFLDLGFGVYADLPESAPHPNSKHTVFTIIEETGKLTLEPAQPSDLWLYRAEVERIVDADTIIVLVRALNNQHHRVRLRLSGVEIPERGTEQEKTANSYLTRKLKAAKGILIKTHGQDRYGRYVADVLYSNSTSSAEHILNAGHYLNAQLIQRQQERL